MNLEIANQMTSSLLIGASAINSSELAPVVAVAAAGTLGGTISVIFGNRGLLLPAVVLELLAGILIGPQLAGLQVSHLLLFMQSLGVGLLFFFAGYEIDFDRLKGDPLKLALLGWALSLVLAYSIGGVLAAAGIVVSLLYTGSALVTTAIGTLIPILSDSGELKTKVGTNLLAVGAVGEFGPILLLTLFLSGEETGPELLILAGFIGISVVLALLISRSRRHALPLLEGSAEKSSQIVVRWFFLLVMGLVLLASDLGLDLLLGGFAAGMIARQLIGKREIKEFETKLTAVAFGVFVPFFFVVSGMQLDVSALFTSASGVLKVPLFFALFLIVRGTPALVLYRKTLDRTERIALALFSSTQLPLVLAITMVAQEAGHMRADTAAALVMAAVLSTLVYPILGLQIRKRAAEAVAA
ncbi:MAG: cation:proton antiporter [Actinomycetes bacterium]